VPVYDLKLHDPTRTLVAGTHGRSMHSFDLTSLSDLAGVEPLDLKGLATLANHPNPFKETTTISLTLAKPGDVRVAIFDVAGRKVRSLGEGAMAAGLHEFMWDGLDDRGHRVASGVYFVRLDSDVDSAVHRLTLVR
jgi:flagellar hook assembly protein FlgD